MSFSPPHVLVDVASIFQVRITRVVIFDSRFNSTWEEQAIGRVYRTGQEKPALVCCFTAGDTFETKVDKKGV